MSTEELAPTRPDDVKAAAGLVGDTGGTGGTGGTGEQVEALVIDELLVEEISIDGMCGVY